MRYLLFSLLLVTACSSEYKILQPAAADPECARRIRPAGIQTSWYTAYVDVVGKHISGLLLIKRMPDSSSRVVFTNEAGVTFFDFEFKADGTFQVKQAIRQLNKKAVVQTLRKDFELLLAQPFNVPDFRYWRSSEEMYIGVEQKKETAYFITGLDCASLRRLELGSKRKRKVTVEMKGSDLTLPETVEVKHHTFAMVIRLKKIEHP